MATLRGLHPRLPTIANIISIGALIGTCLVKAAPPRRLIPGLTVPEWIVLGLGMGLWVFREASEASYHSAEEIIVESPRKVIPSDVADLPYPPDALPGLRDVNSPYGSLRVYEWGPEDGRKVLFVHGISTPCIALGALAHGLVEKGCRVMLFDLWGRGYSDTPLSGPHALPQSSRLFTTSVLIALTSSPLSWTGTTSFSLIGYSLGGGIAADFTSYFPNMVSSLVLIAPSGLQRPSHISWTSKFLYSKGWFPESWLEFLVRRRLRGSNQVEKPTASDEPVAAEIPKEQGPGSSNRTVLSRKRPGINVASIVAWQIDSHQGFTKSFMSSLRHGPIHGQQPHWQRIGERLNMQKAFQDGVSRGTELQNGKVLIILGEEDPIVVEDELVEDATEALGWDNVRFEVCHAAHELPTTDSETVVNMMWKFWGKYEGVHLASM